jgi:hypothetical protein
MEFKVITLGVLHFFGSDEHNINNNNKLRNYVSLSRMHLNQFCHLNLISSTDFWLCTDSYVCRSKVLASTPSTVYVLKRFTPTYLLYHKTFLPYVRTSRYILHTYICVELVC